MNREHLEPTGPDAALGGADRVVRAGLPHADRQRPELQDISGEIAEATRRLYGLDDPMTRGLRPAVPDGPAFRRARRPVRPGDATATSGTSTSDLQRDHAQNAPRSTSRSPACCTT